MAYTPPQISEGVKNDAVGFCNVLWAFSFSLIGEFLAGQVDSYFAVLSRMLLGGLVFLPFTLWRAVRTELKVGVTVVGALQFGTTYLCLYRTFAIQLFIFIWKNCDNEIYLINYRNL
ncbi:hypothetical protein [Neptunomonas antarctica]|nr:hypothetical protein [Neptunomonas antarctica]